MIALEHAPRLVLGLPSTAPATEATVAFARASRRVRTNESAPFDVKDLTAALSQLEGHANDGMYFEYKVPADPAVEHLDDARRNVDGKAHEHLVEAMQCLMNWDWSEARDVAKLVLLETQSEDLRDEALNIIAAASALMGDMDSAIAALKQAVEGQWNFSLQQNLGILALKVDPVLAAHQSTYWLDAAESREDRERAIFLVINMWAASGDEEEDHGLEIPEKIRGSFRDALRSDLSSSTFALLGLFMARNDGTWMADPQNWMSSPHFGTDLAALVMARAEGFEHFVDFLVEQASSENPEIVQARDNFISELVDAMFEEDDSMWAAGLSLKLVEQGLPCDSLNNALLRVMAVRKICLYLQENGGEPKDELIDWLLEVQHFSQQQTDQELKEFIHGILVNASALFILRVISVREAEMMRFSDPLATVHSYSQRWTTRRHLNKQQARMLTFEVLNWANQTQSIIDRLRELPVPSEEISEMLNVMASRQAQARYLVSEILEKL